MFGKKRICPIEKNEAFEEALMVIADFFGEKWLNSELGNPLQDLWRRSDTLSSIELLTLGESINKIKSTNRQSILKNINIIKKKDANGRRGAILEIILAAALHNPPVQTVELLGPQNPVYDLIVRFMDADYVNISIKNFAQSQKDEIFIKNAKAIEQIIKTNLKYNYKIYVRYNMHPSQYEWDMLKNKLPNILKEPSHRKSSIMGNWLILLSPFSMAESRLYAQELSYTLFITVPFHRNEQMRLFSKLNDACADINQKGEPERKNSANILYAHIPYYVLLEDYYEWCVKYLKENPNSPISSIRLIQPAYASDSKDSTYHLFFLYKDIIKHNEYNNIFTLNGKRLINCFPTGATAGKPYEVVFGKTNNKLPKKHYWYQSGNIYLFDEVSSGCKIKHNLKFEYGIHTHSVIRINGEDAILSCNFPPTYELMLL